MSRLLTESPTTTDDDDDAIPASSSENEKKGKTSEPKSDDIKDFTEADYDPVDQILAFQEERTKNVHFDQITMDELISAQLHDLFCAYVCRRLNEGGMYPSSSTKTDC